jgi:nickel-dependent lactate racemase
MAKYEIPYHKRILSLEIPEENVLFSSASAELSAETDNQLILRDALESFHLDKFVERRSVCLIVEDATRDVPLADLLISISSSLSRAESVSVLLATGTHDGEITANYLIVDRIKKVAADSKWPLNKIHIHNCHRDSMIHAGRTETLRNDIYVNAVIESAEIFVTLSDMKNHYFAGYSNALKNFIPGLCAYDTIERNHALAFDEKATFGHHPLHPDSRRRDNPLALDMWEGYQLIVRNRPVYVLATISQKNRILWSAAGSLPGVVMEGIRKVDALMSIQIKPADYLIVSCGGYPNDESLYSAQRALELNKNAVKAGGELLFLAACSEGIGPQKSVTNFYEPLTEGIEHIFKTYGKKYIMYAHKTYKFAQLIQRLNKIYVRSELEDKQIIDIHLNPVKDAQAVIDRWLRVKSDASINIITQGNKVAVYA